MKDVRIFIRVDLENDLTKDEQELLLKMVVNYLKKPEMIRGCE